MISDQNGLLDRQQERQKTASAILRELNLPGLWKPYGTPYLVGAAAYELLAATDIDFEIYCPGRPCIQDGFAVLQACAIHACVRSVQFINEIDGPDQGFYWQVRCKGGDGREWKIDMWSVAEDHPGPTSRDLVAPLRQALNDENRAVILAIKEAMLAEPERHTISIAVYQAVLQGGVRSLDEFTAWLAVHPLQGLNAWKPE